MADRYKEIIALLRSEGVYGKQAARIAAGICEQEAPPVARPLDLWHEDFGAVLWWRFPIEEAPWVGTPNDSDWPGYHTHWTPLPHLPAPPPDTGTAQIPSHETGAGR